MTSSGTAVVMYNQLSSNASIDELDVLDQVEAVSETLSRLSFRVLKLAFPADIGDFSAVLLGIKPKFVFNLVESVSSEGKLSYMAPALLDRLGIRYTGCSAESIRLTADKVETKKKFKLFGIPTPPWISINENDGFTSGDKYIIKALSEDASIGMCQGSVMTLDDIGETKELLSAIGRKSGREFFAERYIDGREFSISILGEGGKPRVLAPLEIRFRGYEKSSRAKIVDYRAKWDTDSFEYKNTFSVNCLAHNDEALIGHLKCISLGCWEKFMLRGYARIDFRVDSEGRPWVLEINANPCITPGASGFVKSAQESGLDYDDIILKIISDTQVEKSSCSSTEARCNVL